MNTITISGNNIKQTLKEFDKVYESRTRQALKKLEQKYNCIILYDSLKVNKDMSWSVGAFRAFKKSSTKSIKEWGFEVPPEEVDLDSIAHELSKNPSFSLFYINHMRKEAPKTYALLINKYPLVKDYKRVDISSTL